MAHFPLSRPRGRSRPGRSRPGRSRPGRSRPGRPRPRVSPGHALVALGAGHDVWGLAAYRRPLGDMRRAGFRDTVGDGLIRRAHSDDDRAAAFWFMFAGPLVAAMGYLVDRADRAGDRQALHLAAATVGALGVTGTVVMPRAPFPLALAIAAWIEARARAA